MLSFIRENINGFLGTLIFHLLLVVVIMATRLSSVSHQPEQSMLIEFDSDVTEEEFRELTESLMNRGEFDEDPESDQLRRNIAVNVSEERPVPDEFREMSPDQMSELDDRVEEILNNAANGKMPEPEQPDMNFKLPTDTPDQENINDEPYTGPTTITYDLAGRIHLRMPVPVYKCPGGGIVEVKISVNRHGKVISANIDGEPESFNERCIFQMALEAATGSIFDEKSDAPPVQDGTITFHFQKQ